MRKKTVLERIYNNALMNRFFELEVARHLDLGYVRPPIYLSVGTEHIPACIAVAAKDQYKKKLALFAQHRCHSYYLSFGGYADELARELCGLPTGCNKGMAGSASISLDNHLVRMFGHSGLLGDQVPIAVGYAISSNEPTVCVLGDAAAEEDYALGALGFSSTKNAPILFIVEDNDLSILTKKSVRRNWSIVSVAKSMGIKAFDLKDDPYELYKKICGFFKDPKPTLLNVNCVRHLWHAGSKSDAPPAYDTLSELSDYTAQEYFVGDLLTKEIWESVRKEVDEYRSRNN